METILFLLLVIITVLFCMLLQAFYLTVTSENRCWKSLLRMFTRIIPTSVVTIVIGIEVYLAIYENVFYISLIILPIIHYLGLVMFRSK